MSKDLKDILRPLVPPIVCGLARNLRHRHVWLEGDYHTWGEAESKCGGYHADNILEKVLAATLKVQRGEAAFERDSVIFEEIQYAWAVLAALMWAAAHDGGHLSVLDFGGALGTSYFQNRKFFEGLKSVRWSVVEQPHYVSAGRLHIQHDLLGFFGSVGEVVRGGTPNAILVCSVLQYIPQPKKLLRELLQIGCGTVVLDRTCYVNGGDRERILIQHVPESIYLASYPCRFLVEDEIISMFRSAGYILIEQFPALDNLHPAATWKGHIFRKEGTK